MKKFLCVALMALSVHVSATDYTYPYLILTTSSGDKVALGVDELEMTFENGQLVAKNAGGQVKYTLANLASMQFSTTDAGTVDAISALGASATSSTASVYDLDGRQAAARGRRLRSGVYIVKKSNGQTSKILVK